LNYFKDNNNKILINGKMDILYYYLLNWIKWNIKMYENIKQYIKIEYIKLYKIKKSNAIYIIYDTNKYSNITKHYIKYNKNRIIGGFLLSILRR